MKAYRTSAQFIMQISAFTKSLQPTSKFARMNTLTSPLKMPIF